MDTFDSRALRLADCYGQRFMKAGTYRYALVPAGADCFIDERPFVVQVNERKSKGDMKQHDVVVRAEGASFRAEPSEITIEAGDLILWHSPNAKGVAYMVSGEKEFFGNDRLVNECGFTHAFAAAGTYKWRDAYGSPVNGVVRVRDPRCKTQDDLKKWRTKLTTAALVMISDDKSQPPEVEIVTGQTVFFAVTKTKGVSVTDERLLGAASKTA
jgi:plastocyanin